MATIVSKKVSFGYHDRSFDNQILENIDALAWKITVNGQSSGEDSDEPPRSRMTLSLSQNLNDVTEDGQYYTAKRLDAMLSRLFLTKLDLSIKGFYQNSDYKMTIRKDDTWNMASSLQYMIKEWITLNLELGYESRDSNYDGESYDGNYAMFNAEFNYNIGSR